MFDVLKTSWALLLGVLLLMIGNGLQGTLLGLRGAIEGFSAATMSWIMSAYFAGFLFGSFAAARLIRRVGHVRVFAALASLISAAFILYAAAPHPLSWAAMRFVVGFCFSGVYVVAESWLNASATNETRGTSLALYMMTQTVGIVVAQGLLNLADPGGFVLFAVMSVLVSVSFAPILLTVSPTPVYDGSRRMSLGRLYRTSPLGVVGTFVVGGVYSVMFGMAAVFATEKGLSVAETSVFVATIYVGGLVLQYPVGYLSDRMDRRLLIIGLTAAGCAAMLTGGLVADDTRTLLVLAFILGGVTNPLYSLLIAYTNDFLEAQDMAAASGALIFTNGFGAIFGPICTGWLMLRFGPNSYFGFLGLLFGLITLYGLYRMTQRPAPAVTETQAYAAVLPQGSRVAMEAAVALGSDADATD